MKCLSESMDKEIILTEAIFMMESWEWIIEQQQRQVKCDKYNNPFYKSMKGSIEHIIDSISNLKAEQVIHSFAIWNIYDWNDDSQKLSRMGKLESLLIVVIKYWIPRNEWIFWILKIWLQLYECFQFYYSVLTVLMNEHEIFKNERIG